MGLEVLVVERRLGECCVRKAGGFDGGVYVRLVREVGDIEGTARDRLHVRQGRPDEVLDACSFGGTDDRLALGDFIGVGAGK